MTRFCEENKVPGAALAVAYQNRLVYARGFGLADEQQRDPVRPRSLFRIASISKPFTSAAVLQLVERGRLKLEDRVVDVLEVSLDGVRVPPSDARLRQVTIRHLLQHLGGWDRGKSFDPMFRPVRIARELHRAPPAGPDLIIPYMWRLPLDFTPGSPLVMFAAATGLRPGEWIALEWRDIDPVARVVYVRRAYRNGRLKCTKTEGSVRAVPLQAIALEALDRLPARAETELLFPSVRGAYFDLHNFRTREWKPAQLAVGISPLRRVYDLRHTFATFALRAGISTFDLSRYMGASLTMIDRHYGHLARDGRDHAINLLDGYSRPDEADVHQVDVAWALQKRSVATPANRKRL